MYQTPAAVHLRTVGRYRNLTPSHNHLIVSARLEMAPYHCTIVYVAACCASSHIFPEAKNFHCWSLPDQSSFLTIGGCNGGSSLRFQG